MTQNWKKVDRPEPKSDADEATGAANDEAEEAATDVAGAAADGPAEAIDLGPEAEDDPVARLETENAELKDQLLRALAETENVRRRTARDREDALKYGAAGFARDMLSVADNLRRALDAIPDDRVKAEAELKSLYEGVELVERELLGMFERHGIKRVDALGQKFDPNLHQALFELEDADAAPGTVVQLVAPGYVIHERLLRPAMVGVAKAPKATETPASDQSDDGDGGGPTRT